ncbi:recombinase RecA [Mycobacterium colombiense]|uniref:Protein RecA n=1 Tax=Mycobacterium colombiense TaxID=339268 RepID=A0A329ME46_9MYCO|nr:recombinase RecA [Mycobacterium colombiense]RAV17536.1 recombinase RecA [Mycobacterium colombiense]
MIDLDSALSQIEKDFGPNTVMRLGDSPRQQVDVIPTGSLALDRALGIGGLPRGRIVEIFGPESSGKSTLCLHAIANAQRAGGTVAYIDTEHAVDPIYAKNLGVDIDNMLISQPDTAEHALEVADVLVRTGKITTLVIDSVAALATRAEIEGDYGDSHVGLLARLMSQAMRKLTGTLSNTNTLAIFVNQLRDVIGGFGYGPKETTTGGRALRFYSSVRLDVRRIETEKSGDEATGNRVRVKVVKNKLAAPFKQAEFSIVYGQGISREAELIDIGTKLGIVKKSGAWFSVPDGDESIRLGQGKEQSRLTLAGDPALADNIEQRIRDTWNTPF